MGEDTECEVSGSRCCDVCGNAASLKQTDQSKELSILYDAIEMLGPKGELKITQWIRGSSLAWTDVHNKLCMSHGNSLGHSENWWRLFIRKCHVLGYVRKELKSIIKKSQHYGIQAIIAKTDLGIAAVDSGQPLILPDLLTEKERKGTNARSFGASQAESSNRKILCVGKGSHGVTVIKKMLLDKENWTQISSKEQYQFPGIFSTPHTHVVFYTPNCMNLPQSSSNPHFMWEDIQISKSGYNKDREITINFESDDHDEESLMYRIASCNGVKVCPEDSCNYVVPVLAQRSCPDHLTSKLIKTNASDPCPVQIAYIYPKHYSEDHRRWIFAFVSHQKTPCESLHNHRMHSSSKICSKVKEMISNATELNPQLTPSQIAKGRGVCAIPGAIDRASNHIGRLSREVKKAKLQTVSGYQWGVSSFETIADEIDSKDKQLNGDDVDADRLKQLSRPICWY